MATGIVGDFRRFRYTYTVHKNNIDNTQNTNAYNKFFFNQEQLIIP